MKVNIYKDPCITENHVDIYYKEQTLELTELFTYLNKNKGQLIGIWGGKQYLLNPEDIYYFESVDKKCFAYLHKKVYQINLTLFELEASLYNSGFTRINKSMIVNIYKINYIKPEINMKVNIYLENGEILIISRHYKKEFQTKINELKRRLLGGLL